MCLKVHFWKFWLALLTVCSGISLPFAAVGQENPQAEQAAAPTTVRISGQLLEKGTKRPLDGVNIFLLPLKVKATTDELGRFAFEQGALGDLQVVVNASGYLRLERSLKVEGEVTDLRLYLERESYLGSFETKVVAQDTKKDAASRSLDFNRFSKAVGGLGDPVRAVQDLPGVNRSTAGAANILIQGSGPNDTKYLIEGHEVPLMFHFGGVSSVVFPESAERIELLAAGYGPEYGRALGGLVGAWTRPPDSKRLKGQAYMDIFNAGGYVEGEASERTHFFFGVRRSYFGEVLGAAFKGNSNFDFVAAPNFGDVTEIIAHRPAAEHTLKLTAIGSQDSLQFVLSQPVESDPSIRGRLSNQISFFRFIPKWEWKRSADSVISASTSIGQDRVGLDSDENFIRQTSTNWSLRTEWQERWLPGWKTYAGIDNAYAWSEYDVQFPNRIGQGGITTPSQETQVNRSTQTAKVINAGLYLRNELHPADSEWTFYPNVRLDYLG
ncbi:MAG: TonB-dependent receptor, partial [Bdellovibrionales bacterium]|nr:TonB-dependent receptor [Bdellovibrionales bacterium]